MPAYIRASCPGFFTQAGPPLLCRDNERLRPPTERPQTGWCDGHSGKLVTWKEWAGRGSGPSLHAAQGTTDQLFRAVPMSTVQAGWLKGPSGASTCPSLAALQHSANCGSPLRNHPEASPSSALPGLLGSLPWPQNHCPHSVPATPLPRPRPVPCICPSPPLLSDGRMESLWMMVRKYVKDPGKNREKC